MSHLDKFNKDRELRLSRNQEKTRQLIQFLLDDKFITLNNLLVLFDYKNNNIGHVKPFLNKLAAQNIVKLYSFQDTIMNKKFKIQVCYLTDHAINLFSNDPENLDKYKFKTRSLNINSIQHRLDIQLGKILFLKQGYSIIPKPNEEPGELLKIPDFLVSKKGARPNPIEIERTVKSLERYRVDVSNYLTTIMKYRWGKIYYISPDEQTKNVVQNAFNKIDYIIYDERKESVDTDKFFEFYTMGQIKNFS